jgi:GxxExxY protein
MPNGDLVEERLIHSVIASFCATYNELGFGFLERAYSLALERELRARSHDVAREVCMLIMYKGEPLMDQRIDMIIDRRLVVEIKSCETLHGAATRQVYNYLRATGPEAGLLLHFGPRPRFWRVFCRLSRINEKHSAHSEHE